MIRAQGDARSILKQADGDKPSHRHSNKIIGNTAGITSFFNHPRRNHWAKRTTQNRANGIRHGHPRKPHRSRKQLGIKRGLLTIGKTQTHGQQGQGQKQLRNITSIHQWEQRRDTNDLRNKPNNIGITPTNLIRNNAGKQGKHQPCCGRTRHSPQHRPPL